MRSYVLPSGVLLFLGLALVSAAPVARKARSGIRPDRVTYTTFRPGNWDIYLFHEAGQTPEQLTTDPGLDYDPVMSRDGRCVVFCSERSGNPRLYTLDLQRRGEPRLLIDNDRDSMEDQAALSPDGKWIAFVSTASGNADIYLLPFRPDKTTPIKSAKNLPSSSGRLPAVVFAGRPQISIQFRSGSARECAQPNYPAPVERHLRSRSCR